MTSAPTQTQLRDEVERGLWADAYRAACNAGVPEIASKAARDAVTEYRDVTSELRATVGGTEREQAAPVPPPAEPGPSAIQEGAGCKAYDVIANRYCCLADGHVGKHREKGGRVVVLAPSAVQEGAGTSEAADWYLTKQSAGLPRSSSDLYKLLAAYADARTAELRRERDDVFGHCAKPLLEEIEKLRSELAALKSVQKSEATASGPVTYEEARAWTDKQIVGEWTRDLMRFANDMIALRAPSPDAGKVEPIGYGYYDDEDGFDGVYKHPDDAKKYNQGRFVSGRVVMLVPVPAEPADTGEVKS